MGLTENRTPRPFSVIVANLPGWVDAAVPLAASRAGANGVLNLEYFGSGDSALDELDRFVRYGRGRLGLKLTPATLKAMGLDRIPSRIDFLVLSGAGPTTEWVELTARLKADGRRVIVECGRLDQARQALAAGADGLIAKGNETGGRVDDASAFVLVQALLKETRQEVWVQGGIGLHSAAACAALGAAGVVLDEQLALTPESTLPAAVKSSIEGFDGIGVLVAGDEPGSAYRFFRHPGGRALQTLQRLGENGQVPPPDEVATFSEYLRSTIGWGSAERTVWPLGQGAVFARPLARRFIHTAGIVHAFQAAPAGHIREALAIPSLPQGAPLAGVHGTRYPILQGPMTRVSDRAEFAAAVANAGALPFLALALLRGVELRELLESAAMRLEGKPWGVGILGFAEAELRREQLEWVRRVRPGFAIIAGGRPDQALALDQAGIMTYLHVPTAGLLSGFIQDGARRFIFEGRECGGHVGPLGSFALWGTAVDALLEAIGQGVDPAELQIVFAGGIHDAASAAVAAVMAAPLTARGVKFGVLMGTGYLFTREAVATGAIVPAFQAEALACATTVLLESGPGHTTRCADTPFTLAFREAKQDLSGKSLAVEEIREALEQLNLGRLRIASKGIGRNPDFGRVPEAPHYLDLSPERQRDEGMYMIGQVAMLRDRVIGMEELHADVAGGLDGIAPPLPDANEELVPKRPGTHREASPIAIVGMGCLLPGAHDPETFWHKILHKIDCVTEIPRERFEVDRYFDEDRNARDKIYSRWGGFVDEVLFDPLKYGIPPNALPFIDPLQLLTLEVVSRTLDDAGYGTREFPRDRTSVILGAGGGLGDLGMQYGLRSMLPMYAEPPPEILAALPEWSEDSFPGFLLNVAAGRVSNRFNFGGVNYVVDAACGSSLAALSLAIRELDCGTSDLVLTGGVDTVQSPFGFLCFSKTKALSPRGRCRAFDASADGIAISEGLAVVALKRLEDAERDGDRIYALIRGVAGSSDGRDKSLTAPSPPGQMRALVRAYAQSGISPATVGLVEAHGTGTVVGDASEVQSLTRVYKEAGARPKSVALGSVKSSIGHTKSAAGMAGLIKTALALQRKVLPPTLHVETPNPKLREPDSPFFVAGEVLPWIRPAEGTPRRAAVSAFGFGGTNFHAVLEEYDQEFGDPARIPCLQEWPAELCLWCVPTPAALDLSLAELEQALEEGARPPLRELAAALWEKARDRTGVRLAVVAASPEELRRRIGEARSALGSGQTALHTPQGVYLNTDPSPAGKLAVLFPGQGSQAPGMLRDLALHFPEFREILGRAEGQLANCFDAPLGEYVFPPPSWTEDERRARERNLANTHIAQPALGVVELAAFRLLGRLGLEPDMAAGHSYGEYVALAAAGVLTEQALIEVSEARGRAILTAAGPDAGGMAAVSVPRGRLEAILPGCGRVWMANFNSPRQTVLSGASADLERALKVLQEQGHRGVPLNVACAFHTPLMQAARGQLEQTLARLVFRPAAMPVFSNSLATPYPEDPAAMRVTLTEHLVRSVDFVGEIEAMFDAGARLFVEVGPGQVLAGLTRKILEGRPGVRILSLDVAELHGLIGLERLLGQLFVYGSPVNLDPLFVGRTSKHLNLARLVAETRPVAPAPSTWKVSGGKARPSTAEVRSGTTPVSAPAHPLSSPRLMASVAEPFGERLAAARAVEPAEPATTNEPPAATGGRSTPQRPDDANRQVRPVTRPSRTGEGKSGVSPVDTTATSRNFPLAQQNSPDAPAGSEAERVMLQFQALMQQFLATQAAVMTAYLTGSETAPPPSAGVGAFAMPEPLPLGPLPAPASDISARSPAPPPAEVPEALTVPEAAPAAAEASADHPRDVGAELLRVIEERTGYPPDMLGLDLRVEADLGIDSIKRVEILRAFRQACSEAGQARLSAAMDDITSARTLREWVDRITGALADSTAANPAASGREAEPEPDAAERLLDLISERTGYPREVLSADAALETDLGIDSIKRVEILGAYQRTLDSAGQDQIRSIMDRLTAARTLKDIVGLLQAGRASEAAASPAATGAGPLPAGRPIPAHVPRYVQTAVEIGPAKPAGVPPAGRVVVITDEGGGVAETLAENLTRRGEKAILLRHQRPAAAEDRHDTADFAEPGSLEAAVERIRDRHGPIGALIHLYPLRFTGEIDGLDLENWRERIRLEIKSLYALARAVQADLHRTGRAGEARLMAVTGLGGGFALEPDGNIDPVQAGIAAMVRSIALEWPEVRCRSVDLDGTRPASELAERLLEEWTADDGEVQVGRQGERRLAPRSVESPVSRAPAEAIGSDWVILLAGGARGITAEIAVDLGTRFKPTLILTGRTPAPGPESPETADLADMRALKRTLAERLRQEGAEPTPAAIEARFGRLMAGREIRRTLDRLAGTGARVEYAAVDVRDEPGFADFIDGIYRRYGRLDAVVYSAGVIEDKRIADKTPESFDRVVRTKTDGAFLLTRVLDPKSLKALIFMTSVTATYGNPGQTDYGAANGVLNGLASRLARQWPTVRVAGMNWGPWDSLGMVSDEIRRQFLAKGIGMVPVSEGAAAVADEIASDRRAQPVLVFGQGPWGAAGT